MPYNVEFTDTAADELRGLPRNVQNAVSRWIGKLTDNPYQAGTKKLRMRPDLRRVHVTRQYVLIYEPTQDNVLVTRIRHRRRVYLNL